MDDKSPIEWLSDRIDKADKASLKEMLELILSSGYLSNDDIEDVFWYDLIMHRLINPPPAGKSRKQH